MQCGCDLKLFNSLVAAVFTQFEHFYLGLFIATVHYDQLKLY